MPDKSVKTIRHLIYYQYAKIIGKSSFGSNAKKESYGFIKKTLNELITGQKIWSDITREDKQFIQSEKCCIYCSKDKNLEWEHIVPKSLKIKEECSKCDKIQAIHNQVLACKECNIKKSNKGLYNFYKELFPNDKKFYDKIPSLLEKKYLKTIYYCHECSNTLDCFDLDGDGEITVLDIDYII